MEAVSPQGLVIQGIIVTHQTELTKWLLMVKKEIPRSNIQLRMYKENQISHNILYLEIKKIIFL